MKNILLKTNNLSKSFSSGGALQHVLKNIDLELYEQAERENPHFSMLFRGWIRRLLARLLLEIQ